MKREVYEEKLSTILQLRQFEKIMPSRKNAKHPWFAEEGHVTDKLRDMIYQKKIDEATHKEINPI